MAWLLRKPPSPATGGGNHLAGGGCGGPCSYIYIYQDVFLVSRGINQFYVYVCVYVCDCMCIYRVYPVYPSCMWALLLFTKWHTSMSKAWMNRTAVTSEPCNSQERRYSCELLRPNATVQFLWHD